MTGERWKTGKRADFVIWDIAHPSELAYMIGANPCAGIIKDGKPVGTITVKARGPWGRN